MRIDPTTTMTSEVVDDVLTIVFPHRDYPGDRKQAGMWARQYGRDRRARAVFLDSTSAGHALTIRYRLIPR